MIEHDEQDEYETSPAIEHIVRVARRPVTGSVAARERLLAAVRAEPRPHRHLWTVIDGGRRWTVTPLRAAAIAAGLMGIGVFAGYESGRRADLTVRQHSAVVSSMPTHPVSDSAARVRTFVLRAPGAQRVALVGDFNEWNVDATPMVPHADSKGVWTVEVPLSAGRHTYSFRVFEGTTEEWRADPAAPLSVDDGFGNMNSVVIVPGVVP